MTKPLIRGVSLVESLTVLAVSAVLAGASLPGFRDSMARRHVEGAAAQLETDIQFTRSLAVAQQRNLRITFGSGEGYSCYVVHSGGPNDCRCDGAGATCSGSGEAARHVSYGRESSLKLAANVRSMVFDAENGTVTPTATLRVEGERGHTLHQVVNVMGRVRSCTPNPALAGYKAC
jgi:type IV fimbrial biogenesis protein FimT